MKKENSKIVFFLGPIVLFIWGLICYRLFFKNTEHTLKKPTQSLHFDQIEILKRDSFELFLDYKDPFGLHGIQLQQSIPKVEKDVSRKLNTKNVRIKWPKIKFLGLVKNANSTKGIAILNIDGSDFFFKKSQEREDIRLINSTPDSVIVSYKDIEKTIYK
tara:strand:+ start:641 stop:1120 length:480 start_codon:yes stop_codon:yes gene_type:complete